MKRFILAILLFAAASPISAQLYHPGEVLDYRISYKAKMFPNTEVGTVQVSTTEAKLGDKNVLKVVGLGRTLPTYRWFFNLEDSYTVLIDPETKRPLQFEGDIHEGDYTFHSTYVYDWDKMQVTTRWQRRKNPQEQRTMKLTTESMDAISLFFSMRSAAADQFQIGEPKQLQMVLEDTIRGLHYRFLGRETKKIRNMGRYNTLKFECQLGTSQGFSFTDGTVFFIWISDDENKIPLYIESPVKVGSINAYISGYKGLKYPVKSLVK